MKNANKLLFISLMLIVIIIALSACGGVNREQTENETAENIKNAEDDANMDEKNTGDAALDNPRNQDEIGERELLIVSFGTSYNDARRLNIGAIEDAMENAFPDWSVRRAFTSDMIIRHIDKRDGVLIDNVKAALERAKSNGVKVLTVQPTHLMNGFEYQDLIAELAEYDGDFESIVTGAPLLSDDEDFKIIANAIVNATAEYDDGQTAICFMGHGTEAESNGIYARMQEELNNLNIKNYFIGTVEAKPDINDLLDAVSNGGYKRVILRPLMIVAGDHANNDMAGDDPESWKSQFEAAGLDVTCILEGLGELPEVRDLFVLHARTAIEELNIVED